MPLPLRKIPKKIHYIWLGGPIPEAYLRNIQTLAEIARRSGFEITLWVENEKRNYQTTSVVSDISIPNLQIRNITELFENMKTDPFYQGEKGPGLMNQLQANIAREIVGFKNLAAASDLLRLEILRQFGGYYFDTDTRFYLTPGCRLSVDETPLGFIINAEVSWARNCKSFMEMEDTDTIRFTGFREINNDIIAASPHHSLLERCIQESVKRYKALDAPLNPDSSVSQSKMDQKRSVAEGGVRSPRGQLTLNSSGPGLLSEMAKQAWDEAYNKIHGELTFGQARKTLNSMVFHHSRWHRPHAKVKVPLHLTLQSDYGQEKQVTTIEEDLSGHLIKVAGLNAQPSSHLTWLRKQTTQPTSFGIGETFFKQRALISQKEPKAGPSADADKKPNLP